MLTSFSLVYVKNKCPYRIRVLFCFALLFQNFFASRSFPNSFTFLIFCTVFIISLCDTQTHSKNFYGNIKLLSIVFFFSCEISTIFYHFMDLDQTQPCWSFFFFGLVRLWGISHLYTLFNSKLLEFGLVWFGF